MWVVPTFDPFEHGHLRFRLTFEPTPVQQLTLEGGEKALRHRIVVADPGAADGLPENMLPQRLSELPGRVVAAMPLS